MFEELREGLKKAVARLFEKESLDEKAVKEFIREIQRTLIKADVNVKLVFELTKKIEERIKEEGKVPGVPLRELAIKILYEELAGILGEESKIKPDPKKSFIILLVGIQGSGKTTTAAKLAKYFQRRGFSSGLVCADTFRPGAYEQLKTLGERIGVEVFGGIKGSSIEIARKGIDHFLQKGTNIIIVDTAGRHKEEKGLLEEMRKLEEAVNPNLTLLIVDGTIGQQCYAQAKAFDKATKIGGIIITKLDGTARGGGALAAAAATGAKVYFISTGEKIDDLEEFSPMRFVGRLLGFGDIKGLLERVKRAQISVSKDVARRIMGGKMTLEDFLLQIEEMGKVGPLEKILEMIPGVSGVPKEEFEKMESQMKRWKAVILSMTPEERRNYKILNASRIRRIAYGSGAQEREVKNMLQAFEKARSFMKSTKKLRLKQFMKIMPYK